MTWLETLKALFKSKNIDITDDELKAVIETVPKPADPAKPEDKPADPAKPEDKKDIPDPNMKFFIEKIDALSNALAASTKRQEDLEKRMLEDAGKEQSKKIDEAIEAMKSKGKIPKEATETEKLYRALFEKDFETTRKTVDALPDNPALAKQYAAGQPGKEGAAGSDASPATKLASSVKPGIMKYLAEQTTEN